MIQLKNMDLILDEILSISRETWSKWQLFIIMKLSFVLMVVNWNLFHTSYLDLNELDEFFYLNHIRTLNIYNHDSVLNNEL